MKRIHLEAILYSVLFLICAAACTTPIELDTKDAEPVIVIYSVLTSEEKVQSVRISRSSPYFSNEPNAVVSDASVVITSSANERFTLIENVENKGTYETSVPMAAKAGLTYHLTVEVDFDQDGVIDRYEAETVMQPAFQLDSIQIKPIQIMGYSYFAINLFAQDSPEEDYYLSKYQVNDTLKTDRISRYDITPDQGINGEYIKGMTVNYLNDVKEIDDFKDYDDFDDLIFVTPGDSITLYMCKIEEGYYDFIYQCIIEMRGENPFFGGPASNITTNISNGGVGYFTAYTVQSVSAKVP